MLIDIPVDIAVSQTQAQPPQQIKLPGYRLLSKGHARQIESAADAINKSDRPVVYVGGGVISSNAAEPLRLLIEKANIPATMTLMGLGAIDQNKDYSLDMLGMHGTAYANYAVQNCDLLLAVGARFDDRVTGKLKTFAPNAKIVHIDIDPASISKNVYVDIPVVGDAGYILNELAALVKKKPRKDWFDKIAQWKQKFAMRFDNNSSAIKPQYVIQQISEKTKGDAIIATGVGQHQMWTAQFCKFTKPRHLITSGGLGTMGFGLPAAIGAQVACPEKTVIDIDGDSSFNMTMTELSTAVMYDLPIKVVILNNGYMGMVRQWQELFYHKRYSQSSLKNPSFAEVATSLGAVGITVDKKSDVSSALDKMLKEKRPCVLDVKIEREENVWPMVAAGKGLDEMTGLDILESMA